MVKLSADFKTKLKQMYEIRTAIDLEPYEILLDKQTTYFDIRRNDLQKHIADLKENYTSVLKYERLNVTSFEPLIEKVHALTEKYLKRL
jgi:hypothetical protein